MVAAQIVLILSHVCCVQKRRWVAHEISSFCLSVIALAQLGLVEHVDTLAARETRLFFAGSIVAQGPVHARELTVAGGADRCLALALPVVAEEPHIAIDVARARLVLRLADTNIL